MGSSQSKCGMDHGHADGFEANKCDQETAVKKRSYTYENTKEDPCFYAESDPHRKDKQTVYIKNIKDLGSVPAIGQGTREVTGMFLGAAKPNQGRDDPTQGS